MSQFVDSNSVGVPSFGYNHGGNEGLLGAALIAGLMGRRNEDCGKGDNIGLAILANQVNTGFDGVNENINTSSNGINHNINSALDSLNNAAVLGKLGSIEGAIPAAALQIENSILEQSNAFQTQLSQSTLATLAASAGVKDAVQNSLVATLAAGNANTNQILEAVQSVKDQSTQFRIADLERQLGVAQVNARDSEIHRRMDGVEVNVTQSVTNAQAQVQAQSQAQQQLQIMAALAAQVSNLANDIQVVRQSQSNINFGVQAGTTQGQAATNNRVS